MADDLEAFLRQAAQRRAGRKKPAPAQPAPQPPASAQSRRPQPARRPPPAQPQVVEATVIPEPTSRLDMSVDTSDFERRAEHLGEEVGLADEHLETRLHDKFDHKLGALSEQGRESHEELGLSSADLASANDILALIADPVSLRNAIVLSEVLAPPRHRW